MIDYAKRLSPIFIIFQEICVSRQVVKVRHIIKVRHCYVAVFKYSDKLFHKKGQWDIWVGLVIAVGQVAIEKCHMFLLAG